MTVIALYKWTANPQDASVAPDGAVRWSGAKPALSEYDAVAIEVARQVAKAVGQPCVGVSLGKADASSALARKTVLARGLDSALIAADDATASWNLTDVARALAGLVARLENVSLVAAGDVSIDEGAGIIPALAAGYLGWPCLLGVTKLEPSEAGWTAEQAVPGGTRSVEVTGPLVAGIATDAAAPRPPGIKDVLAAGKKPAEVVPLDQLPAPASIVQVVGRERPGAARRLGKTFSGQTAAADLIAALRADGVL
ncbi:MAG: hypothetical protein LBG11_00160 [Bifidobacteriaceae bacterium]|jgi:electron transfer flavoprotein beta subunit|nr:hypothetical protein [Bifidobacteriaceae bacterium]